jgi:hypothetical protein
LLSRLVPVKCRLAASLAQQNIQFDLSKSNNSPYC